MKRAMDWDYKVEIYLGKPILRIIESKKGSDNNINAFENIVIDNI